jgi:hypothetical protein
LAKQGVSNKSFDGMLQKLKYTTKCFTKYVFLNSITTGINLRNVEACDFKANFGMHAGLWEQI